MGLRAESEKNDPGKHSIFCFLFILRFTATAKGAQ